MRVLLQRVLEAKVEVSGTIVGAIKDCGILAFVGFGKEDDEETVLSQLQKLVHLRIFPDKKGRFDLSLIDINGSLLLVPQFTLYADTTKGRRPEFFSAMPPDKAAELFLHMCSEAADLLGDKRVSQGVFGADMNVSLVNYGPVTIMLET
jgi:D-aminoacyl-tRNA deacylase